MKARITFDTLAYANRLKAAGLEPKIAETQAEVNAEMLTSLMEDMLVTKQDLAHLTTKQDLVRIDTRFEQIESRLTQHIDSKTEHLDTKIEQIDSKFSHFASKEDFVRLESRLDKLDTQLTLRLGGIVITSLAGITAFFSFFHSFH